MARKSGWFRESRRHSLASRGIKSAQKIPRTVNLSSTGSNIWQKNGLGIPYSDQVTYYANKRTKEIIPVLVKEQGKGWFKIFTGDFVETTRFPNPNTNLTAHYGDVKKVNLFSETSFHSGKNNPNRIKRYGTNDYTLDYSSYTPMDTYKLVQPVKSNLKKGFGKPIKKVTLQKWDYIVLDWIPDDKIKLQIKHTQSTGFDDAGQGKVLFKSKRFPLSEKKKVIADFRKYVEKFEKKR